MEVCSIKSDQSICIYRMHKNKNKNKWLGALVWDPTLMLELWLPRARTHRHIWDLLENICFGRWGRL